MAVPMTFQKRAFSINRPLNMEREELQRLSRKLVSLREKREKLKEEYTDLKLDKETANEHRLALVKKENQQAVTEEEENAIADIKESYPEFFDSDVEQSDPDEETSPEYKERKQVKQVIDYLSEELKSTKNEAAKIHKE